MRVKHLPWWKCQLGCRNSSAVFSWRGRVRCVCQLSDGERYQLAHDRRLDKEEKNAKCKS